MPYWDYKQDMVHGPKCVVHLVLKVRTHPQTDSVWTLWHIFLVEHSYQNGSSLKKCWHRLLPEPLILETPQSFQEKKTTWVLKSSASIGETPAGAATWRGGTKRNDKSVTKPNRMSIVGIRRKPGPQGGVLQSVFCCLACSDPQYLALLDVPGPPKYAGYKNRLVCLVLWKSEYMRHQAASRPWHVRPAMEILRHLRRPKCPFPSGSKFPKYGDFFCIRTRNCWV